MNSDHATLAIVGVMIWGLGLCILAACVLIVLGIVEREMALKLQARRDVERAALRAAGEDRHRGIDVRV